MSLILEALKKSEANRRLGEAPDLETPFAARRRRKSPLPFIVAAIVVAGVAGWWLLRTPTAGKPTPAATQTPAAEAKPAADRIVASADSHPAQTNAGPPSVSGAAHKEPAPTSSPFVAIPPPHPPGSRYSSVPAGRTDRPAPGPPAGMKKAEPGAAAVAQKTPAAPAPVPVQKKPELPSATANPVPNVAIGQKKPELPGVTAPSANVIVPTIQPGEKKPEPGAEVKNAPPVATGAQPGNADNAANAKTAAAPAAGASVQPYYLLPFSVRKDLPAIKLSMHVYAPEPAQRFIILNDSRMSEGDAQDDLALREIRPDGAVFEFRGQRFFYPRDGL